MKRTMIASIALVTLSLAAAKDLAAQEWFWGLAYQVTTPSGDTKDFADDFSFRNLGLDGRAFVKPNVSFGFFTAWNVFAEKTSETISIAEVLDVTGEQFRYINAVPILATAHYYFGQAGRRSIKPYVGLGLGTYWIEQRFEIGFSAIKDSQWHFGVAPEVGIVLPLRSNIAWYLNARYNYAVKANNFTHQWFGFGIGFAGRT